MSLKKSENKLRKLRITRKTPVDQEEHGSRPQRAAARQQESAENSRSEEPERAT